MAANIKTTNLSVSGCIKSGLEMYNPNDQWRLQPEIRKGVILPKRISSIESLIYGLNTDIMGNMGAEMKKTNPFYEAAICCSNDTGLQFKIAKPAVTGTSTITTTIVSNYSPDGTLSLPQVGHQVAVKGDSGEVINGVIASVTTTTAGAHGIVINVANNKAVTLANSSIYHVSYDPSKLYPDTGCITGDGSVTTAPTLTKGYMQSFADRICIDNKALTAMGYDRLPINGMELFEYFDNYAGEMKFGYKFDNRYTDELERKEMLSKAWNTLYGVRDKVAGTGFDGVIPTAKKVGLNGGSGKLLKSKSN
jgi:hypothetical protein